MGSFRTSAIQSLYVEVNEPLLYLRFDKLCVQYALKLRSNPDDPVYDVFNPQFYDLYGRKLSARSFGHCVEEDLSVIRPQLELIQSVIARRPTEDYLETSHILASHTSKETSW